MTREFKIAAAVRMNFNKDGVPTKTVTNTDVRYDWKREHNEKVLAFRSLSIKMDVDGFPLVDSEMSRERVTRTVNGKMEEKKADDSPALKSLLQDSFGSPICKLEVDATGKELSRTVLAGPGAKGTILNTGMIALATFFHPPFRADREEWQEVMALSVSKGATKGTLTYTKVAGGTGQPQVNVRGTLSAEGIPDETFGGLADTTHVVSGTQTYDLDRKEWGVGKHEVTITLRHLRDGKEIGSANGTATMTFEMLPEK